MDMFDDTELMKGADFFGHFAYQDFCPNVTNLTG